MIFSIGVGTFFSQTNKMVKNILPSLRDKSQWVLATGTETISDYELKLNATSTYQHSYISLNVEIGQPYTFYYQTEGINDRVGYYCAVSKTYRK